MTNYKLVTLYIVLTTLGFLPCSAAKIFHPFRQTTGGSAPSQTASEYSDGIQNENSSPIIQVREVLPTELQNDIDPELNQPNDSNARPPPRNWIWRRDSQQVADDSPSEKSKGKLHHPKEEHPLRTDLWKLNVQWFRPDDSSVSIQSMGHFQMEFHTNGQCRLLSSSHNGGNPKIWGVGTWTSRPYGVSFSVPCKDFSVDGGGGGGSFKTKYIFTAQLHHNPFGKQPKFQQGMIIMEKQRKKIYECDVMEYDEDRDRFFVRPPPRQWFRPVVGKFTGEGIGLDTLDYSYSKRKNN